MGVIVGKECLVTAQSSSSASQCVLSRDECPFYPTDVRSAAAAKRVPMFILDVSLDFSENRFMRQTSKSIVSDFNFRKCEFRDICALFFNSLFYFPKKFLRKYSKIRISEGNFERSDQRMYYKINIK